jgi:GT2 family glycosyltransferase
MPDRVCVVLVTYNRLPLLRESLTALHQSTIAPATILVVDNQSTDGTSETLAKEFPYVQVIRPPRNVGSAGGYFLGLQWAQQREFDWVWALDDDTIVAADAL